MAKLHSPRSGRNRIAHWRKPWEIPRRFLGGSPRSGRNRIAHRRQPWEARRRFLGGSPRSGRNRIAHRREPWEARRRFLGGSPRSGRNSLTHVVSREDSFDWEATVPSERVSSRLTPRDILFRPLPWAWCTGGLAFPNAHALGYSVSPTTVGFPACYSLNKTEMHTSP